MPERPARRPRPPATPANDWALFLDVDGCLLDFAAHPAEVSVDRGLRASLERLSDRLDGAVALVSGRAIADLDALFEPLRLPAAGLHGLEWRSGGQQVSPSPRPPAFDQVRDAARRVADAHPGALVEDKGVALALHWRGAPDAESAMQSLAGAAVSRLPGYLLQPGNHVVELRPGAQDKGSAVRTLMSRRPFRGRTPVFAGDDLTDEHAFAAVNDMGGLSILVGEREPSAAALGLADPAAVRAWLAALAGAPTPRETA